jgi:hypothetical protein
MAVRFGLDYRVQTASVSSCVLLQAVRQIFSQISFKKERLRLKIKIKIPRHIASNTPISLIEWRKRKMPVSLCLCTMHHCIPTVARRTPPPGHQTPTAAGHQDLSQPWPRGPSSDPQATLSKPAPLQDPPPHIKGGRAQLCSLLEFTKECQFSESSAPGSPTAPVATMAPSQQQPHLHKRAAGAPTGLQDIDQGQGNRVAEKNGVLDGRILKEEGGLGAVATGGRRRQRPQGEGVRVRELRRLLVQGDFSAGALQASPPLWPRFFLVRTHSPVAVAAADFGCDRFRPSSTNYAATRP